MKLDRQPQAFRRLKNQFNLFNRERNAFTECINGIHQTVREGCRKRLIANEFQVLFTVLLKLLRQCMSAQKTGPDIDRPGPTQASGDAQHLQFRVHVEPVARLDLDRRDTLGQQGIEALQCGRIKVRFACQARGAHRGGDAAACHRDLGIGDAGQAQFELIGPVAAMDQMGMAVDETGCRQPPAAID